MRQYEELYKEKIKRVEETFSKLGAGAVKHIRYLTGCRKIILVSFRGERYTLYRAYNS